MQHRFLLSLSLACALSASAALAGGKRPEASVYAYGPVTPTDSKSPLIKRAQTITVSVKTHKHGMAFDKATKKLTPAPKEMRVLSAQVHQTKLSKSTAKEGRK